MPVLGMAERIAHNAAYVQSPPTLERVVGAFFSGHGNQPPPTLVRQPPLLWFYA